MVENKTVGFIGGKFLPLHLGHVYAIVTAAGYVDELYVVLSSSKKRDKELCERDGASYMSSEVRLSWLGECFNDLENVKILHVEDDSWDYNYDWEDGVNNIKKAIGKPIDFIFGSEEAYEDIFAKYYPSSKYILIDVNRENVSISATEIRRDVYSNWDMLPICVRSFFVKKVAVIGTESCGKSTLVKKLSKFYNTNYVHEVGRNYCDVYSNQLTLQMFDHIAMEHFLLQAKKIK